MAKPTVKQTVALVAGLSLLLGVLYLSYRTSAQNRLALRSHKKAISNPHTDLPNYIATHAHDEDPKVQDAVGESRLHVAFAQANESWKAPSDKAKKLAAFETARKTFLITAREYKGTGDINPDFGGIPDEAAYQAAVCLVAEGKNDQAKTEFIAFMKNRPLSPLCKASYRRLVRLNGGKPTAELDALIQKDADAQGKEARFETSVCGPRAIQAVLPLMGKPAQSYKEIAKLCGTTDTGTSIDGMRKGLKAIGLMSYGVELNASDFAKLQTPAIMLIKDHYVVVTHVDRRHVTVFDPTTRQTSTSAMPASDDPDFLATVITFSLPELASN